MVYVRVLCGVRYVSMGLHQEEDIIQPMERMTSSGDRHHDCLCKFKWSNLKSVSPIIKYGGAIKFEACCPLWCQWNCEDVPKSGSPIVEYGGAIN